MIMLSGILLIFLGLLAIPSLVIAKKPDAKALFDKVAPYQGWIGLIFAVWGVIDLIRCLMNISFLSIVPFFWILWLAVSVVTAALGFILGYGLINKYVLSKNPAAAAKGEATLKKLLPLQGVLGLAAIALGIVLIILVMIYL